MHGIYFPLVGRSPSDALCAKEGGWGARSIRSARLQRLNFDLAPPDHACAILERDAPARVLTIVHAHRLLAVELDGHEIALGLDLHHVPIEPGFRHRIDLGDIDDGARAVARIGTRVEDVDLVAIVAAGILRIVAADE